MLHHLPRFASLSPRLLRGVALVAALLPAVASASLMWETTQLDLPAKPKDSEVHGQFCFVNRGERPVTVLRVRPSCSCTVADLGKTDYAPGESGVLDVTLSFTPGDGVISKSIFVTTDKGDGEEIVELRVKTESKRYIVIKPTYVMWGANETPSPKSLDITAGTEQPVHVLDARTESPDFDVNLETLREGRHYRLTVTPSPSMERRGTKVHLSTDFPADDPFELTVAAGFTGIITDDRPWTQRGYLAVMQFADLIMLALGVLVMTGAGLWALRLVRRVPHAAQEARDGEG